jgi:hypothetical protein
MRRVREAEAVVARMERSCRRTYAENQKVNQAHHLAAVRALRDEVMPSGAFTPADWDEQAKVKPSKRKKNLFLDLMHASPTRRYAGTGVSEYDAIVQYVRDRAERFKRKHPGRSRLYAERLREDRGVAYSGANAELDRYVDQYAKRINRSQRGGPANGTLPQAI